MKMALIKTFKNFFMYHLILGYNIFIYFLFCFNCVIYFILFYCPENLFLRFCFFFTENKIIIIVIFINYFLMRNFHQQLFKKKTTGEIKSRNQQT